MLRSEVAKSNAKMLSGAKSGVWDFCPVDHEVVRGIEALDQLYGHSFESKWSSKQRNGSEHVVADSKPTLQGVDNFQNGLQCAADSGTAALASLDASTQLLHLIRSAYEDVAGRTNSLVSKCENLLDQQHTLQATVEVLRKTVQPFEDIEHIAQILGIPYDSSSVHDSKSASAELSMGSLDPRSPEFLDMLQKLSSAVLFLAEHPEIKDSDKYRHWLEKLQTRAVSLVGRAMRDLFESAGKKCREIIQQKLQSKLVDDQPLESTPLYQKFRGLSFRMKELSSVLMDGVLTFTKKDGGGDPDSPTPRHLQKSLHDSRAAVRHTFTEVRRAYALLRVELLQPFLREAWMTALTQARTPLNSAGGSSGANLAGILDDPKLFTATARPSTGNSPLPQPTGQSQHQYLSLSMALRQVFSTLVRVAQLEHQLFDTLFISADHHHHSHSHGHTSSVSVGSTPRGLMLPSQQQQHQLLSSRSSSFRVGGSTVDPLLSQSQKQFEELVQIVDAASNATRDFLRPLIIKESSVDELCRVVSVLSEDMRGQISVLPVPVALGQLLLQTLETTVNDAKERLTYCAETKLRQEVQLFEPLPSHLAFPANLEALQEKRKKAAEIAAVQSTSNFSELSEESGNNGNNSASVVEDAYQTWYPPMRSTLSLLSKLYTVVAPPVFEDFARRSIEACVQTLKQGADGVRRRHAVIHGDLFLVRHLLLLREQLVPFDIKLQSIERQLDFSSTGLAFSQLVTQNAQTLWRWDVQNSLLRFAQQGLPQIQELHTDAKQELDQALRKSCLTFKQSALKMLLGPLEAFLAKVSAFLGEIPFQGLDDGDGSVGYAPLPPESIAMLKNQSFLRPERMKECLEEVQTLFLRKLPDVHEMLDLYVEGEAARMLLQKSLVQEFDVAKHKMETVLYNCVESGVVQREIAHMLQSLHRTINTSLLTST